MEPVAAFGVAATAIQSIQFSITVAHEVFVATMSVASDNWRDYGALRTALLYTVFWQARGVISRIRKHVLDREEHDAPEGWNPSNEALAIKTSYASSFNMISVAGAIAAQIAITALSLAGVGQMHWTVTAAFLTSLIAGLLSVYYACIIQVWLGGMHSPENVREWLTAKRLISSGRRGRQEWIVIPSYNAALILVAPLQLLNWSLASLLVGVGVHYGLFFAEDLGTLSGTDANLAVLLVFILFTLGGLATFVLPNFAKLLEQTTASKDQFTPNNARRTAPTAALGTEMNLRPGAIRTSNDLDDSVPVELHTGVARGARQDGGQPVIVALEASIAAQTASLEAQKALLSVMRGERRL